MLNNGEISIKIVSLHVSGLLFVVSVRHSVSDTYQLDHRSWPFFIGFRTIRNT